MGTLLDRRSFLPFGFKYARDTPKGNGKNDDKLAGPLNTVEEECAIIEEDPEEGREIDGVDNDDAAKEDVANLPLPAKEDEGGLVIENAVDMRDEPTRSLELEGSGEFKEEENVVEDCAVEFEDNERDFALEV